MATVATLEALFGGRAATRVLLFMENYGEGYAREIARNFDMPSSEVQKQLAKFELTGVLVSRMVGNARVYSWNPRDPSLDGLRQFLRATLDEGVPAADIKKFYRMRKRPRRAGKPL